MSKIDYFIDKFSQIPEEKWTTEKYIDEQGRCCAYGHCGQRGTDEQADFDTEEAEELHDLFWKQFNVDVATINDGCHEGFPQKTPKERILAALRFIKSNTKV